MGVFNFNVTNQTKNTNKAKQKETTYDVFVFRFLKAGWPHLLFVVG